MSPGPGWRYGARLGLRVRSWGEATDVAFVPDAGLTLLVDASAAWLAFELRRFGAGLTAAELLENLGAKQVSIDPDTPLPTVDDLTAQLEGLCDHGLAVRLQP